MMTEVQILLLESTGMRYKKENIKEKEYNEDTGFCKSDF